MAAFIAENMAPIMFAALVIFLLLGYPVAFSLGACGLMFFVIGVELSPLAEQAYDSCLRSGVTDELCKLKRITLDWPLLGTLPERIYGIMSSDTLLAIPFFTFMGLILERSGMAEDLLDTVGQLFGTVRGGIAFAVVFVGALLAATTGVVAASVISMGLISLPIMLRYGYDRRLATGVIAASGTLAQIIPPSLVLIVMADQLGRSVGDMYQGAFVPGLVLTMLYAGYVLIVTALFKEAAPGLPPEAVGFQETSPRTESALARLSGMLLVGLAGYFLFKTYAGLPAPKGLEPSGLFSFAALTKYVATVGTGLIFPVVAGLVSLVLLVFGLKRLIGGRDKRGLSSLLMLALGSTLIAVYVMKGSHYKGADFVILTMAVAILAAFLVAVVNWVLGKLTGVRFLSLLAQQVTFVMVPPLLLIFLVLGTIFIGIATPTEGGALGAVGALALAIAKRFIDGNPSRFNFTMVRQAVEGTAKLSAFVLFILIGARIFSLTFYGVNGHLWVEHLLVSLPGGQTGFLIFVNVMVFLLAFFLDFFELAFIIVPLLAPAAEKLGIDLIWFGIILGVNMQTSFMHPPFGFALFYLRSVAPREMFIDKVTGQETAPVTTGQIYWGAVPFVIIQCIMVALVITFPQMVLHYKDDVPKPPPPGTKIEIPKIEIPKIQLPPIQLPGAPK
ncbi:MAG: TRAP transporter large permease subunit [Hyphomicrobiaceae bacterium]